MKLISINHMKHIALKYASSKTKTVKLNSYFSSFFDKHNTFEFFWINEKAYIKECEIFRVVKDLDKIINRTIKHFDATAFELSKIKKISVRDIKIKIENQNKLKKIKKEEHIKESQSDFNNIINQIKTSNNIIIGAFDLEFWEQEHNKILEFGWIISEYHKGIETTTHLIVNENIKYKNNLYSYNNRFSRNDSDILPLTQAKQKFINEFINKVDVFVGHGLENDIKVLKNNGIIFDKPYVDLSNINKIFFNSENKISLTNLLKQLKIKHNPNNMHNAATDSEEVLKCFFKLGDL